MTLGITSIFTIYFWQFGQAMFTATEWPDLAVTISLSIIAYYYAMVLTWKLPGFFPSQAFGELIMPLIELVYSRWL